MRHLVCQSLTAVLRWHFAVLAITSPAFFLGCNHRDPNDKVVLETRRQLKQAREEYGESFKSAKSQAELDDARVKYQAELRDSIQKVADGTTHSRREASLILQRHMDEASTAKQNFTSAFEATLNEQVLNPTLATSQEDYECQRTALQRYIDESRSLYDSTLSRFKSIEDKLNALPKDEYVTGLLIGLQSSLQTQQPFLKAFTDAHQECGRQRLSLVNFLESRHGKWRATEGEIQFEHVDDMEIYSKRVAALLQAEDEVIRLESLETDALNFQLN